MPPPSIREGGSLGEKSEEIPGAGQQHEEDLITGENTKEEIGGSPIRLAGGVGGTNEGREEIPAADAGTREDITRV